MSDSQRRPSPLSEQPAAEKPEPRTRLGEIRAYIEAATDPPWWFDESDLCWRLHGTFGWTRAGLDGAIQAQPINKQILKAPKRGTSYAEYWPDPADGEFIVKARTDLPLLLGIVEAVLEVAPSMHQDHGPIPDECRFCAGEAAGLRKVRELIANHLIYGSEETADDDA